MTGARTLFLTEDHRRLEGQPALAAPAEQVLVRVDEAGSDDALGRVDDVMLDGQEVQAAMRASRHEARTSAVA
jgi:hypothetical protein